MMCVYRLRTLGRTACVLLVGVILALGPACSIRAQDSSKPPYQIVSSTLLDPQVTGNGQGREVHCSCFTANDRIVIYRQAGTEPISSDLSADSDFSDALWLFDVGNTGHYQLAVLFHDVDGKLTADVYQDHTDDAQVSVSNAGGRVRISEPGTWSLRVVALDGYWQRGGRLAPDFDLSVDDSFAAAFGSEAYVGAMKNDGNVDVVVRVRGPKDGDPRSYDWRNVELPIPKSDAILRTTLSVRENGQEPGFAPRFPWYLLGEPVGMVKPYGESFPPIQVDWAQAKIVILGEFVASRGSDVNWFTYSLLPIEPDAITEPDFESPFAFYDLADDHDSVPELEVRVVRVVPNDPILGVPYGPDEPNQLVRYSWDQDNTQNWSFKLGLLGRQSVEELVPFSGFTLRTIPYSDVPTWVTSHQWDIATFVAVEGKLWTSEGIYDWDGPPGMTDGYYSGISGPAAINQQIAVGRRGEYALSLHSQPWLYFSSVDHQLHLAGAEAGVWNIDDHSQIRYINSNGGDDFDGWQRWEDGRITAQLYLVPGGLLYSDSGGTWLKSVDVALELFRSLPPATHSEWQQLGQQIGENRRDFGAGDLRAMFDQFAGTPQPVADGALSDFDRSPDSVSFVVDVDEAAAGALAALTGSNPGIGLRRVTLQKGSVAVAPLTYSAPIITITATPKGEFETIPIQVDISNPGSFDIADATLEIRATTSDGKDGVTLTAASIDVPGNGSQSQTVNWAPGRPGDWIISASLQRRGRNERTEQAVVLQQQTVKVEVKSAPPIPDRLAGKLGSAGGDLERVVIWLGLIMAILGFGVAVSWGRNHNDG